MPISGKPQTTTIDDFIAFARALRADGATFVKAGALEVRFSAHVPAVADEEPAPAFTLLPDLDDSERAELQRLRQWRDQAEELS